MLLALCLAAAPAQADDTATLQAVLDAGHSIILEPGRTYRISRSLRIIASATGIIGDGTATLLMGSGPGEFDNASPLASSRYGANAVGIIASGVDHPIVQGIRITYEHGVDDRYVKAVAFRNCTRIVLDHNEAWNFTKALGILYVGGSSGGSVSFNAIHDSRSNSASTGQITGIELDNDDRPSSNITIAGNDIHDITVGREFLNAFGDQTDGINTVRHGTSNLRITENRIRDVGEAIDHFGRDSDIAGNQLSRCYNFCIKLIHGASFNQVHDNAIRDAGLGGIVLSGTKTNNGDTRGNVIYHNRISGVDRQGAWRAHQSFGIGLTANFGTTYLPRANIIEGNVIDLGGTGQFGIMAVKGAGSGNRIARNIILHARSRATFIAPTTVAP